MMSFSFKVLIVSIGTSLFLGCSSTEKTNKKTRQEGVVSIALNVYENNAPSFSQEQKIWYRDSSSIQEIRTSHTNIDINGVRTDSNYVLRYTFINRKNKSFIDFSSFTDTARILKKYTQEDSVRVDGGWNYYFPRKYNFIGSPSVLNDTLINGINCRRKKFIRTLAQNKAVEHVYFRCDKNDLPMSFGYFDYAECPIVRIDTYTFDEKYLTDRITMNFLSDTLTVQENNLFDNWERK